MAKNMGDSGTFGTKSMMNKIAMAQNTYHATKGKVKPNLTSLLTSRGYTPRAAIKKFAGFKER